MSTAAKTPNTLAEATSLLAKQQEVIESLTRDVQLLRNQLQQHLRGRFGRSSERFEDPNQLGLFGKPIAEKPAKEETPPAKPKRKNKRKRAAFGEGLRREESKREVPEELQWCSCCNPPQKMHRVGWETSETLEITPPDVFVRADMRPKVACPSKQGDIITPLVEPRVLPKARVGVSMLVYILLAKYQDHRVPREAVCEMRVGPSQSGCRAWLQTALSCAGKEPGW